MNKTIQNLTKAFIGESMARNRYSMYAKIARTEGFEQISEIFLVTAENEREHATWIFRLINELKKNQESIKVEAEAITILSTTEENLKGAIAGEHYENSEMYPSFANVAEKEGYPKIAARLRSIAKAEMHHEERYKKLLKEVAANTVFKKDEETEWICRECGYAHTGKTPPKECPSCGHPTAYFQVKCEKY